MQLSRGEVVRGVGGGLCQLANLLYWMSLHTPLEIAERHQHSFDPFPDEKTDTSLRQRRWRFFLITSICDSIIRRT